MHASRAPKEVTRTVRITNERDEVVITLSEVTPAAAFEAAGAEGRIELPIGTLRPGRYLLSVEVSARGESTLTRQLSFTIR